MHEAGFVPPIPLLIIIIIIIRRLALVSRQLRFVTLALNVMWVLVKG